MKNKNWIILAIITVIIIFASSIGTIMSKVEKPKYITLEKSGNIEIREYEPTIIAEVSVKGERKEAIREGFKLLANYIFGNNLPKNPSSVTAQQEGQKIAMTAPVQQIKDTDSWKINFTMPSEYSIDSLPSPNTDKIKLIKIPKEKRILIQFSGSSTDENIQKHLQILRDYCEKENITINEEPIFAFYNPPWTLPFLRRNEIMFKL